ncbi:MAG: heme-binding domain-containing protein [Acidobacteria bacterium]|nr:heme-binding domain-containing protein [Acidobacteriota bacterium]
MKTRGVALAAVAIALAIQLVRPARVNPPVQAGNTMADMVETPLAVHQILERACRDCHSHRTRWPWYSQVAPASWLLARHVSEGRQKMNLDDWKEEMSVKDICQETRVGSMPLKGYLALHPDAKLSGQEIQTLCSWSQRAVYR